jgi:hypothetical protein
MGTTKTPLEKSVVQKCNLYKKQSLYRDTSNTSIKIAGKGNSRDEYRAGKRKDSEATKSLKDIVADDDTNKVERLGRALLRLYAVQQKQ